MVTGVEGDEGGSGFGRSCWHAVAPHGAITVVGSEAGDEQIEGGQFATACFEPDVVVGHRVTVSLREGLLALVDESDGGGVLLVEHVEVGRVGDEQIAGEACVAFVADVSGWEQTPAVGQDPVGALVELHQVVEVLGGHA